MEGDYRLLYYQTKVLALQLEAEVLRLRFEVIQGQLNKFQKKLEDYRAENINSNGLSNKQDS